MFARGEDGNAHVIMPERFPVSVKAGLGRIVVPQWGFKACKAPLRYDYSNLVDCI